MIMRTALMFVLMVCGLALPASAQFETRARAAFVLDQTTNTVLLEKNADAALPPASMSKLMTLYMLFEALEDGRVTLGTQFNVSARAKAMGGSTMFLNEQDRPTVDDLIHGIIVNSGNEACVTVAEGLAGTEDSFARLATARAQALGMTQTHMVNASGWPAPAHRMSMHDLGILAKHLIEDFPQYYPYFSVTEFDYKNRAPQNRFNRNPLFKRGLNADGLKTGHTIEAGYGLVGSAVQGDRRVIVVVSGLNSEAERGDEAERLFNWAFRQFAVKEVTKKGQRVASAQVWMGAEKSVDLVVGENLRLLVPAIAAGRLEGRVVYDNPVTAPIVAGSQMGYLEVSLPGMGTHQVPLLAERSVDVAGFAQRLQIAAEDLMQRFADRNAPPPPATTAPADAGS